MKPIVKQEVQDVLDKLVNKNLYIHLETTNGAYASFHNEKNLTVGAYIRNSVVRFSRGSIVGNGPYRVGLKMEHGWIYAEGLTDWELDEQNRLLLAGHDGEGRLTVALQLSDQPF
ncbi:YojF family protein [Fictibacillus sp. Mic-4]|uniref:YojF family protein n=1 Tax=Fictibacillus sp. Mic-4 TaxID=3132826 RepID=UPI003CEAD1EE